MRHRPTALARWGSRCKKTYLEPNERQKARPFSPAVVTEGGRIVWMAGQTATVDADGRDISADFEAQTRRVFALMDETLRRAGGALADLVAMTVFIKKPRHGDRFVEIRRGLFPGATSRAARSSRSRTSRGPASRSRSRGSP